MNELFGNTENLGGTHMKNPIQPLEIDSDGILRFKRNAIVRHLLDTHPTCSMNTIASMDFSNDDRQQFAQLIGYSLSGYGELESYVDDAAFNAAARMADGMAEDAERNARKEKAREIRQEKRRTKTEYRERAELARLQAKYGSG